MAKSDVVFTTHETSGIFNFSVNQTRRTDPALDAILDNYGAHAESALPPQAVAFATQRLSTMSSSGGQAVQAAPVHARIFRVEVDKKDVAALIQDLLASTLVESAYEQPRPENPLAPPPPGSPLPSPVGTTGTPPNYQPRQTYLAPSPAGIDAYYSWTIAGGDGEGVKIIDIEGGWCLNHFNLDPSKLSPSPTAEYTTLDWRDHGTAVLGEMGGRGFHNGLPGGVRGIAHGAQMGIVSHYDRWASDAIAHAMLLLEPGDVMLLEMHSPGPNHPDDDSQKGYIAVEWWPSTLLAIQLAVMRGIIVVAAAGNGGENLDSPIYNSPLPGQVFPPWWRNPFNRAAMDSGTILVGAGAPPTGTYGPDRSRLDFSNYGSALDCQGWGRDVVTLGYGDLFGAFEREYYTDTFSGTSSASPIVAASIACMQGIAKKRGRLLSPSSVRSLLRTYGAPQQAGYAGPPSQRIGMRPDLKAIIPHI